MTKLAASTWTSFVGRQLDFVQFWFREHGSESREVSAHHVHCLISGWDRRYNNKQAGKGKGGRERGRRRIEKSNSKCSSSSKSSSSSNSSRRRSTNTSTNSSSSWVGGGVGWGASGGDPGRSLALHRRGTAEGSARLDVVEKTSVEGLLLPFLYQKLYEYHQKHLAVLAVQREMEDNFRMHAENGGNHGARASIIAPRLRYQAPSHDARYQSPT